MNPRIKAFGLIICTSLLLVTAAQAVEFTTWHWNSSPTTDATGLPLAPAEFYEVFLTCDTDPESLVATVVGDTVWVQAGEPGITYRVRVQAVDADGRRSLMSEYSEPWLTNYVSGVGPSLRAAMGPAVPNPFNPRTTISYVVPDGGARRVDLRVFDLRGRLVRVLPTRSDPGTHAAVWDGRDGGGRQVSSGIYLAQYRCDSEMFVSKLTLVE